MRLQLPAETRVGICTGGGKRSSGALNFRRSAGWVEFIMSWIDQVEAREILGIPVVTTGGGEVTLVGGEVGGQPYLRGLPRVNTRRSSCVTATSKRYGGKGVLKAVKNVNDINCAKDLKDLTRSTRPKLTERCWFGWTKTKSNLGANALLAVSMATARSSSSLSGNSSHKYPVSKRRTCPCEDEYHATAARTLTTMWTSRSSDREGGRRQFSRELAHRHRDFSHLKAGLEEKGYATSVGDEGALRRPFVQMRSD